MKIENQNISKLEDYALNEFVKLQLLDLSNNKITKLSDNSFDAVIETSTFCSVLGKY